MNSSKIVKPIIFISLFCISFHCFSYLIKTVEGKCPICGTNNKYPSGSFLGIYPMPYNLMRCRPPPQLPNAESLYREPPMPFLHVFRGLESMYSCKKCKFTIFVSEYRHFSREPDIMPMEEVKDFFNDLKRKEHLKENQAITYSKKIEILEKIYWKFGGLIIDPFSSVKKGLLKDKYFWLRIYSMLTMVYKVEKLLSKSAEARKKSVQILEEMFQDPEYKGIKKELLCFSAALSHLSGNESEAISKLMHALKLPVQTKWGYDEDCSERFDKYLSLWILYDINSITDPMKKKKFFNWLYIKGNSYFIYLFRTGLEILLFSFILWGLFFVLLLCIAEFRVFRMTRLHAYINPLLALFIILYGTYQMVTIFEISEYLQTLLLISVLWLFLLISSRLILNKIKSKKLSKLKILLKSRAWVMIQAAIILAPFIIGFILNHKWNSFDWLHQLDTAQFLKIMGISTLILKSLPTWFLMVVVLYLLHLILGFILKKHKVSKYRDYCLFFMSIVIILFITYRFIAGFKLIFHPVIFIVIGVLWLGLTFLLEFKILRKVGMDNNRNISKTKFWYLIRMFFFLAPVIIGYNLYWMGI